MIRQLQPSRLDLSLEPFIRRAKALSQFPVAIDDHLELSVITAHVEDIIAGPVAVADHVVRALAEYHARELRVVPAHGRARAQDFGKGKHGRSDLRVGRRHSHLGVSGEGSEQACQERGNSRAVGHARQCNLAAGAPASPQTRRSILERQHGDFIIPDRCEKRIPGTTMIENDSVGSGRRTCRNQRCGLAAAARSLRMRMRMRAGAGLLAIGALLWSGPVAAQRSGAAPFRLEETTIAQVHAAFAAKTLTCRSLVQAYLDRIAAYDKKVRAQCDRHDQSRCSHHR
jgi:hypothetical protein